MASSDASEPHPHPHKLTKFFNTISIFITGISVLAAYSTTMGAEYSIKKNDIQAESLTHLVKSQDWWSDYQAHKLREKLFQMEIDNLNITLNQLPTPSTSASHQQQSIYKQTLSKYQSYLSKLHADKLVTDSIANLGDKAQTEQKLYGSVETTEYYTKICQSVDVVCYTSE
ncbi:MAG: DUF4337 family protein [Thermoproteota archaeon]|nr:DUF4337 family protein [Thermoproteota archaeon]